MIRVFDWITQCHVQQSYQPGPLSILDSIGKKNQSLFKGGILLFQITKLYRILYSHVDDDDEIIHKSAMMIEELEIMNQSTYPFDLQNIPIGISLPIQQILFTCRDDPQKELLQKPHVCKIISRYDIARLSDPQMKMVFIY